jgi:hypothetical protein
LEEAFMSNFVLMTLALSGRPVLVNAGGVSCIVSDDRGCKVYFLTALDDTIIVAENLASVAAMLDAREMSHLDKPRSDRS